MPYPLKPHTAFRASDIAVFLAGIALLFFLWFGMHLLAMRLAEGSLQRPYGCLPRDIACVDQHRQKMTSRIWLAYLVVAPPIAGLTACHISRQERRSQKRRHK
ncbi:hypothetical protein [Pseudanabaena sp. FACHB-2040]|uniref:hypothetical protein n=1 Tax=Pseudanabaena sp. FACHB-2040 TaxID=2692859 RepID=UPI0016884E9D|nr:hypothetical protein [Pseudanabaena sp. FACHB-2040]MBD2257940.1 hypothetical protein [Pseudanabaena sp. FACHB-2040]